MEVIGIADDESPLFRNGMQRSFTEILSNNDKGLGGIVLYVTIHAGGMSNLAYINST